MRNKMPRAYETKMAIATTMQHSHRSFFAAQRGHWKMASIYYRGLIETPERLASFRILHCRSGMLSNLLSLAQCSKHIGVRSDRTTSGKDHSSRIKAHSRSTANSVLSLVAFTRAQRSWPTRLTERSVLSTSLLPEKSRRKPRRFELAVGTLSC